MHTIYRLLKLTPIAALCAAALPALATNGYFPHGYGLKAKGMGGNATALAQDSLGGATNPASMVWAGTRMDVGVDVFMPKRDAERTGSAVPTLNGKVTSDSTRFYVPEFGYNRMMSDQWSLGVSVYGNGGMNTNYPVGDFNCGGGAANMHCGAGRLGVDVSQLIVAPTVAYKLNAQHSVGVSLLLGYQQFRAQGLQAFGGLSGAPADVTNKGYDSATGFGLRVGYMGRLTDSVTVGAAYAPKMNMGRFDKYKGLFADAGDFDIPSHYSFGIAFAPTPGVTLALEVGRINYSDASSVSNPSSNRAPLGAANGPGFGWKDIDVFKLGVAWRMSDSLTLRAGYNKGDNPITSADVSFNVLAPGVMQDHYTAGFTWAFDSASEITAAFMVAPRKTVSGPSLFNSPDIFPPGGLGGSETIGMKQTAIGLAWGRKF